MADSYNTFVNPESVSLDDTSSVFRSRAKAPEAKADWTTAAQLMIADIVGVGVLTLAMSVAELGWVMGVFFLLVFFPVNLYTGLLLWKVAKLYPGSVTYFHMARKVFPQSAWARSFVGIVVYAHILTMLGDYVLVLGQTLGLVFYDYQVCKPWWIFLACVLVVPFNQLRLLSDAKWLCWVNMATITVAVVIAIGYLVTLDPVESRGPGSVVEAFPAHLDIFSFARAFSKMGFAYSGQFLYLEIMSEMKDIHDFPKSFILSGPYQVGIYLLVGCVGYYYKGSLASGLLIDYISFGPWLRASAVLLLVHMIITYLVKSSVMSRAVHLYLSPRLVNDIGTKAKLQWFSITSSILLLSFFIANIVPFFESLTGLIGSLLVPVACWNIPIVFYVYAKNHHNERIHWFEYICLALLFVMGIGITLVGTYINVMDIMENWAENGDPFSCHCDDIWNTCACSPRHQELMCNLTSSP